MKIKIKCAFYKLLFRLVPVDRLRAYVLDRHVSVCPGCSREMVPTGEVGKLLVSLQDAEELPQVWPWLQQRIDQPEPSGGIARKRRRSWVYVLAGAAVVILILLSPFRNPRELTTPHESGEPEQVVIHSVKLSGESAKYYIFQSSDPNKLVVWAQRNTR